MIRNRFGPRPTRHTTRAEKKRVFHRDELRVVEYMAKLGATNQQMADYFEIDVATLVSWKSKFPKFAKAFKKGGIIADLKVGQSLYKRATGYSYIEEEYSTIEIDGQKKELSEMCQVKRTKKVLPPDVKAAVTWLKVRQREIWCQTQEVTHHMSGRVSVLHARLQDIDVNQLTPESKKVLFEISQQQLLLETGT